MKNYTEEVFHQVNSEEHLRAYLGDFTRSIREDTARAFSWKERFPRIYNFIIYPLVTRHLKKTHFGQIVPLEEIENILGRCASIVRLPCVCRKVTTGQDKRYCLGVGMDLTGIFRDIPEISDFERLTNEEAKAFVRHLDGEGQTHSVWTFNTPFIAAVCNCDTDCMAYRFQMTMGIGKVMWKGEYIAQIDSAQCIGCRECLGRCYFGALSYDRNNEKCLVDPLKCYGCGICRTACMHDAITLTDRSHIAQAAHSW
ncbi:MAG: ATP-binding protein [Nitrospirota bacterium]